MEEKLVLEWYYKNIDSKIPEHISFLKEIEALFPGLIYKRLKLELDKIIN